MKDIDNDTEEAWQKPGFDVFVTLWNVAQNLTTPILHLQIASWLQERWMLGDRRVLLQAFRGSGKSSLAGLFSAWLLIKDPALRILVLSAELSLATKMARHIRTIIERHPSTVPLIPPETSGRQWSSNKFTVARNSAFRDPSVWAAGLYGNITGARADVIICDDVEVPNTCDTPDKRKQLRERLSETEFILTPGGMTLYIGTPHCYETIYAAEPRAETGEDEIFLKEYARLKIPLLDEEGGSAWPERFRNEDIELQKRQAGPIRFSSQMMLEPIDTSQNRLDISLLQRYDHPLHYKEVQGKPYLSIGSRRMASCAAWWDPAFAAGQGDASVVAVIFNDDMGNQFLHHVAYISAEGAEDEARNQCRQVARIARQFYLPGIAVETNGIGKFLPSILKGIMAEEKVPCGVIEKCATLAKDQRILTAFDAVMAACALHVHESVYATPFIREMKQWRPGLKGARDDGLDAAAGALLLKPVQIQRRYYKQRFSWQTAQHNARTDFPV